MKLIIDFGNSRIKVALFYKEVIVDFMVTNDLTIPILREFVSKAEFAYPDNGSVEDVIVSSVVYYPEKIKNHLLGYKNFIELNSKTSLPFTMRYCSPETLGNDRISAVAGALQLFPGSDLLVIDAGTCITYDFVNSDKEYFGGGISPGIDMRFKALNNFTDKLPLVTRTDDAPFVGMTTKESIQSGVLNGIISEVNGIIEQYEENYPGIRIIFTGGDAIYFDRKLKNNIFANSNLVMIGLNKILNINLEE